MELDAAEPLYRSAGSAPADKVAPTAADAAGPPASKESLFKNTFGKSRPQQAKLGFPAAPGGAAADAAMSGEQSEVSTAAVEASGADASGGLVDLRRRRVARRVARRATSSGLQTRMTGKTLMASLLTTTRRRRGRRRR